MKPPQRGRAAPSGNDVLALAVILALGASTIGACSKDEARPAPIAAVPKVPAQTGAQRLTAAQFKNAVHDLFGEDIAVPPALEPDTSLDGFTAIGSSVSAVSPRGVEQYEEASYKIAAQVLGTAAKRAAIVPCQPKAIADEACASSALGAVGRRVWRRPLDKDELATLTLISGNAATVLGDFHKGLEYGLAALIQSPNFLYRAASGEPDPETPGKRRYTSSEMATRLAFFLWNGPPDDELLDAGDEGALTDLIGLTGQTERLLDSPKARRGLRNFVTEWLRLDQLDTLSKDPLIFTYFSPEVGPAAREETLLDFEHLAFDLDGDYRDIMTSRRTHVNPKLASMYRVQAPSPDGFAEVELPATEPRRGLLGHASILALYAHPTSSSATLRGKFVRTQLLCGTIPPPPVDVNTALPEPSGKTLTLRDRVGEHLTDPFCSSCHLQMDPIGLGLENFDGLGRFRKDDHGGIIDASGDLDGAPFQDPLSLAVVVRDHPAFVSCFVRRMYEYATSFKEKGPERAALAVMTEDFKASGHRIRQLMIQIALSPGFRLASEPQ